jgi:hypothetical protein
MSSPEQYYRVEITETLQLSVECAAETPDEAEDAVRAEYKAGKYVLGAENFSGVEFNTHRKE